MSSIQLGNDTPKRSPNAPRTQGKLGLESRGLLRDRYAFTLASAFRLLISMKVFCQGERRD